MFKSAQLLLHHKLHLGIHVCRHLTYFTLILCVIVNSTHPIMSICTMYCFETEFENEKCFPHYCCGFYLMRSISRIILMNWDHNWYKLSNQSFLEFLFPWDWCHTVISWKDVVGFSSHIFIVVFLKFSAVLLMSELRSQLVNTKPSLWSACTGANRCKRNYLQVRKRLTHPVLIFNNILLLTLVTGTMP